MIITRAKHPLSLRLLLAFAIIFFLFIYPLLSGPIRQIVGVQAGPEGSPALYSQTALLINLEDGRALLERGSREKVYPASLTKIMTVLVALENLESLDQLVYLPGEIFGPLLISHASQAGFSPGDSVPVIDLLYGAMLPSGAECCVGLAERVSGSEKSFVELMNSRAGELGMKNTHFTNCTGLQNSEHYTTAADLALLLREALQNDTFRQILTARTYTSSPTASTPEGLSFTSTLFKHLSDPSFPGGEILGGKTGYTSEAGLCLASLAVRDSRQYLLITTGAPGDQYSEQYNITDAIAVFTCDGLFE